MLNVQFTHDRFEAAHAEIGMKILGAFLSVEDPDTFFFMHGFPDLSSREPMKAKFYEGELWKRELESILPPMGILPKGTCKRRSNSVRWLIGEVWLANCYGRADFTGNRAAQVNWLSLSERIRWQ